jgi:predicted ATPase/DNA-binding CsgD family transcriptional regulator
MAAVDDPDRRQRGRPPIAAASSRAAWAGQQPVPLTTLIGREREIETLRALLVRPAVRLVTLTGPGGVGKTRLAVEVASELDADFDTLAFVPLAAVRDPDLLWVTVARALDLQASDETAQDAVRAYLQARTTLLTLDNVEHLLVVATALVDLVRATPGLTVLVTSRALLRVSGEHVITVPPLTLPEPGVPLPAGALTDFGAVRLFVERCQAVRSAFAVDDENAADVVDICRRLDGVPLAIELAAARITVLPPNALLARLQRRLPLLTDGPHDQPERLRAMRAGIAWSYDLLSPDEQRYFRRLAAFTGPFTLAAAEAVGPSDGPAALQVIAGLVDKSLLQQATSSRDPRLLMLETIREYAGEQLAAAGEETAARRAHAAYFRQIAEEAGPGLRGALQQQWRDRLEADLDNLRAALAWTLSGAADPADADTGLRLVGALWYFWFQRGLTGEARRWLSRALEFAPGRGKARAEALLGAGTLAWRQGDCPAARTSLDESAALWRAEGDLRGLGEVLHVLGHVRFDQRDYADARELFQEALQVFRDADDLLGGLPILGDLGLVAYHEGDYESAERILRESLARYREHGLKDRVGGTLNSLGDLAKLAGDTERAVICYEESLSLWRELRGTPGIASALHKLGQISRSEGDNDLARARFAESLALQRDLGNQQGIGECLAGLAATTAAAGHPVQATQLFAASAALLESIGFPLAPADRLALGQDIDALRGRLGRGDWDSAWAVGSAMSPDQAIHLALASHDGDSAATAAVAGPPVRNDLERLSRRELQVCGLIAEGLTNRQISQALSISERTVGSHVDHIMTKLNARSRTRIAVWAVQHGLGRWTGTESRPSG